MPKIEDGAHLRVWHAARLTAKRLGFHWESEDAASQYLLDRLLGNGDKQNLGLGVIDAIRKLGYGKAGGNKYAGKQNRTSVGLNSPEFDFITDGTLEEVERKMHEKDFEFILSKLDQTDRTILCLYAIWGFMHKEIGFCLGITESAVTQRMTLITKKVRPFFSDDRKPIRRRSTTLKSEVSDP